MPTDFLTGNPNQVAQEIEKILSKMQQLEQRLQELHCCAVFDPEEGEIFSYADFSESWKASKTTLN